MPATRNTARNPADSAALTSSARRSVGPLRAGALHLQAEEVHEVRGQEDEPAGVDGGDETADERERHVDASCASSSATFDRSSPSSSGPVWSTIIPCESTNSVIGKATAPMPSASSA